MLSGDRELVVIMMLRRAHATMIFSLPGQTGYHCERVEALDIVLNMWGGTGHNVEHVGRHWI